MARLVLTRRSRQLHRLSRLVLRRHVILQRRAPTVMMLRALGLRASPGMGRVWRIWPARAESRAFEPPPALEPHPAPAEEVVPVPGVPPLDLPEAAPEEMAPGPAARPAAEPETPLVSARAQPTTAAVPAVVPAPRPPADAPPASPPPLMKRLAGAARKVIDLVRGKEPYSEVPAAGSQVLPEATSEPLPPATAERQPQRDLEPVSPPVLSADAVAEAAGTEAVSLEVAPAGRLETTQVEFSDAVPEAETRPRPARPMPAEPARLASRSALPNVPPVSADEPRSVGDQPGREARPVRLEERPAAPAAAAPQGFPPDAEASPASVEVPHGTAVASPVAAEAAATTPETDRDAERVAVDDRVASERPVVRAVHVAEERRPRRPPPPPVTVPQRAAAGAAAPTPVLDVTSPADPATLFERKPDGRAPADWLGRLEAAAQEAQAGREAPAAPGAALRQPSAPRPRPAPTPISMSARRFLRPLVGIDPAEVVIYRGVEAAQEASARGADALARGEEIAVGTAGSDQEPRMLGLLAHELTHVVRHRVPRFIPPVARGSRIPAGASADDEEALAGRVEAQVRAIAEREADARVHVTRPETASAPTPVISEPETADTTPADADARGQPAVRRDWGGLPAPWEPMPEFVGGAPAWTPFQEAGPGSADAAPGEAAAAVTVHRAATDRSEVAASGSAPASPAAGEKGQPAPDLDALARQVYAVLRRRIAAERRRDG